MTTYARIKNGIVQEIVTPVAAMANIPIAQLYAPEVADAWIAIDGLDPQPAYGWTYDGTAFSPPPAPEQAEPRARWFARLQASETTAATPAPRPAPRASSVAMPPLPSRATKETGGPDDAA